jgi:hypothetical protein
MAASSLQVNRPSAGLEKSNPFWTMSRSKESSSPIAVCWKAGEYHCWVEEGPDSEIDDPLECAVIGMSVPRKHSAIGRSPEWNTLMAAANVCESTQGYKLAWCSEWMREV